MEGSNLFRYLICGFLLTFVFGAPVEDDKQSTALPAPIIKSLHINTDIKYTYAKTWVSSRVLNPANKSQEVHFRVVLPEEAFITGLVLTIKGKPYNAYIKEKEEAKKDYEKAVSAGVSAAHVSQDSRFSKDFTVSVNVEAEDKVNFNLTYEELLSRKNKTYSNEINVNPNQIVNDLSVTINIEDILNITNVQVQEFKMDNTISSSDAENALAKKTVLAPNKVKIEWNPSIEEQTKLNKLGLNGKLNVKYSVDASNNPQTILVDRDGYFVHILRNDNLPVLRKHVVFVLDVSGSMSGSSINQVKEAMNKILLDLSGNDYFSIVLFSDSVMAWGPSSSVNMIALTQQPAEIEVKDDYVVLATPENVTSALNFVKSLRSYSSTNILGGIRNGLKLAKLGQQIAVNENLVEPVESMLVFLTDGQPNVEETNPDRIIEKLHSEVKIFSLGFGDYADMNFLKKISLGTNAFARKIYRESDASLQLHNFYKEIASPVLSDVHFEYLPDQVENITTGGIKNLFRGSELLALGRVKPNGNITGTLTARTKTGIQKFVIPFEKIFIIPHFPVETKEKSPGYLEKMWAYKTIKSLLDNNTVKKNASLENEAKRLALKYSFVTPLTSLVVVKPNDTSLVTEGTPKGNSYKGLQQYPRFGGGGGGPVMANSFIRAPMRGGIGSGYGHNLIGVRYWAAPRGPGMYPYYPHSVSVSRPLPSTTATPKTNVCKCNNHGSQCIQGTDKCICTTKGVIGDHCDKCDEQNHYQGDPKNGSCFYELTTDYTYTFNMSKKEDEHYTQIGFKSSPLETDLDAELKIDCPMPAKINITVKIGDQPEKPVVLNQNCSEYKTVFNKSNYHFGMKDNETVTTFYISVFDFKTPIWIQVSVSQPRAGMSTSPTRLNATESSPGLLVPPSQHLNTTDVTALNETNPITSRCGIGNPC